MADSQKSPVDHKCILHLCLRLYNLSDVIITLKDNTGFQIWYIHIIYAKKNQLSNEIIYYNYGISISWGFFGWIFMLKV